ncbi:hypothetical protein [Methylobacterium sp. Leaf85]|uniref:hypothetical protein n=1 Tax=Methylobacterium sp. Leaf85 TaxID=1736241 RepID=UPI003FCD7E7E
MVDDVFEGGARFLVGHASIPETLHQRTRFSDPVDLQERTREGEPIGGSFGGCPESVYKVRNRRPRGIDFTGQETELVMHTRIGGCQFQGALKIEMRFLEAAGSDMRGRLGNLAPDGLHGARALDRAHPAMFEHIHPFTWGEDMKLAVNNSLKCKCLPGSVRRGYDLSDAS